jgi:hypothetical protein
LGKYPYFPNVKSLWKIPQEYEQETTPSNPSSNQHKLYFKSDGFLYTLNSVGTEAKVDTNTNTQNTQALIISASDETTALETGTGKATFRMPYAFTLTNVRATLTTAGTGVALVTVDINESGTSILSTKITIDATEKTSTTASTAPVIDDASLADDSEITIDIDTIDSGAVSAGLKIYLIGNPT